MLWSQTKCNVIRFALNEFILTGAAYGRAENEIRALVHTFKLPFLPTPMGKGVVPDGDEFCVSNARSTALLKTDVILLLGARLNWILHFGRPPRFSREVRVIQVKISKLQKTRFKHLAL